MKKVLIALAAVAMLAGCSKDEEIKVAENPVIGFDNAFVENSTRATDTTKANLNEFSVYGSLTNTDSESGLIFDNTKVYKPEGSTAFQYDGGDRFWVPSATYDFVAIAPYGNKHTWLYNVAEGNNAANGTITFFNNEEKANAQQDLVFAYQHREMADNLTQAPGKVEFTFNHLLSRVKFTFKNMFNEGSKVTLKVTEVYLRDVCDEGKLQITDGVPAENWTITSQDYVQAFGNAGSAAITENGGSASTEHLYLIPSNLTHKVAFKVELIQAGVSVKTYEHLADVTLNMEKGHSYNIVAKLDENNVTGTEEDLYKIEFDVVKVENWADFEQVDPEDPYKMN